MNDPAVPIKALQSISEGVTITDPNQPDNPIVWVNEAFLELTGYDEEEVVGRNCRFLQGEETSPEVTESLREAIDNEESITAEIRNYKKDGTLFWNELTIDPVFQEGQLVRYVGIQEDITDRKQAQQELERTQKRLRQVTETIDEVFWLTNEDRELLYISPSFEDLWGTSADRLYEDYEAFLNQVHPEDRERVRQALRSEAPETGEYDIQYRMIRPDGETRWIQAQAGPVEDDQDEELRIAGVARDITEQKSLRQDLEAESTYFESLFDAVPSPLYIKNQNLEFERVNQSTADFFGLDKADLIGKKLTEIDPSDQAESAEERHRLALNGEIEGAQRIRHVHPETGKTHYFDERYRVIQPDPDSQEPRLIAVSAEITQRVETRRALKDQLKFLETLNQQIPGFVYRVQSKPDHTLQFSYISEGIEEQAGISAEEVMEDAERITALIHPEDQQRVLESLEQSRQHLEPYRTEFRFVHPDGTVKWTWLRSRPRKQNDGTVEWSGIGLDITERKQTEQELKETERRLRQVTETINEVFWLSSPDKDLLYLSPGFEDLMGVPVEDALDDYAKVLEQIHPEDRERVETAMRNDQISGEYDEEYRVFGANGDLRWVRDRAYPVRNEEGEVVRIAGLVQDITEQKTLQSELREKTNYLQSILNSAPNLIMVKNADLEFELVNDAAVEFFGASREELRGTKMTDWIDSEQAQTAETTNREVLHQGSPRRQTENHYQDPKTGEDRWFSERYVPINPDADVENRKILVIATEVTHQVETRQQLQSNLEFLETINRQTPGVVFRLTVSPDGTYTFDYMSEGLDALIGVSASEAKKNPPAVFEQVHPDDRPELEAELNLFDPQDAQPDPNIQHLGIEIENLEYRVQHPDGSMNWVRTSATPTLLDDGRIRWIGLSIDITDRKQARQQLEETERRLRQVTETIDQVFWLTKVDKTMLYASPAFEEIWGIPVQEIYEDSDNLLQRIHPEDRERVRTAMYEQQTTGEYDETYRIIRPDGEQRWIRDRAFPIHDEKGEVYRIAGTAEDITERKELEQELEESLEVQTQLLQDVHHRVKNNLQVILGLINQQIRTSDYSDQTQADLEDLKNRILTMALIHNQVYRQESFQELGVEEYFQQLIQELGQSLRPPNFDLTTSVNSDVPNINIETLQPLALAVNELASNTFKHGFEDRTDGQITLSITQMDDQNYQLIFEDNGTGSMDPDDLENPSSLGLNLVTTLVEQQLNGSIELLESNSGVTYRIQFVER